MNAGSSGLIRVCRLAEGGMARVDLAIKRVGTFRRMYAVKRLHPHLASDPEFRSMFIDEARIAGLIRHPNVVGVIDVGEDEQGPFLVMDYVDGLPLGNLLARVRTSGESMPVQIAVRIGLDVTRGLQAAHSLEVDNRPLGVVHRDLSPQNVMVGFDGQARLTDFGVAKALGRSSRTATGIVKGKTSYLAPEQIRLEEPDRRSDLFSLGVVLFEMLSGERLYKRADGSSDMHAIIEEPVPDIGEHRSDVPDELVRLLFELLAKARDARPADAGEVVRRLESILAELIAHQEPLSVAEYVGVLALDAKQEQDRVLAEAMREAERTELASAPVLAAPAPRPPARRGRVVAASLAGAALALVALFAAQYGARPEPTPEPTSIAAPPAPALPAAAPTSSASPPAAVAIEPETSETAPSRVRPAKTRKRPPSRARKQDTKKPMPEWLEFGR